MFEEHSIQAVSAGFADTWWNVSTDTESCTALRVRFWFVSCFYIFQPSCYTRSPRQKFTVRISSNGHWGLSWSAFLLHCQWVWSWLCTVCRAAFVSLVPGHVHRWCCNLEMLFSLHSSRLFNTSVGVCIFQACIPWWKLAISPLT